MGCLPMTESLGVFYAQEMRSGSTAEK